MPPRDNPAAVSYAPRQSNNSLGMLYMIAGITTFSLGDVGVKWLGESYPPLQIIFVRSIAALIPLAIYIAFTSGGLHGLRTHHPTKHLVRGLIGIIFISFLFTAFSHMPLANVVAIMFAAPLFITALSVPFLGERVGIRRWSGVVAGFIGVLIMVRPGGETFQAVALLAVGASFFYALGGLWVRHISRTETSAAIVFYNILTAILVSACLMPWLWVTPTGWDWGLLFAVGFSSGLAQILVTNAFRYAEASVVAPLDYVAILWATLFGYLIWGDIPDIWVWVGAATVVASGLYILHRESRFRWRWNWRWRR